MNRSPLYDIFDQKTADAIHFIMSMQDARIGYLRAPEVCNEVEALLGEGVANRLRKYFDRETA